MNSQEPLSLEQLHRLLQNGIVKFSFLKRGGEKRITRATLNEQFIPQSHMPTNEPKNAVSTNLKFYDVEKSGWRSLVYDCSTVEIIEVEK